MIIETLTSIKTQWKQYNNIKLLLRYKYNYTKVNIDILQE